MLVLRYILGALMIVVGALIVSGVLEPRFGDPESTAQIRTMFGIVLILFGIFRIAALETSRRRNARERHINGEL